MATLFITFVFIFGTIIGSFLNVVILRYGTGKNIFGMGERSMCFSCGKQLHWHELIPVVSFLALRGRCAGCKSKISWQYPLVEIATGLIFAAIVAKNFPSLSFLHLLPLVGWAEIFLILIQLTIWSILIVITVYDLRHKIIPDALVYAFGILAIGLVVLSSFFMDAGVYDGILNHILAGLAFFGFFAGMWLVSGGRWLGFGDAKLVLGVGFLLRFASGVSALALSFWIGAVVSLLLIGLGKGLGKMSGVVRFPRLRGVLSNLTIKSEIPFAPFIILGTLIAFFCQLDIFGLQAFF